MRRVEDRQGVESLLRSIERAWNRGDVKSYARLYAKDARYLTRAGIPWIGRKAIEKGHAAAFRDALKGTKLKTHAQRVRFLTSKATVAYCAIELSGGAEKRLHKIRAVTRFALKKTGSRWEIQAARTREIPRRRE